MDERRDDDRQNATNSYPSSQPLLIVANCLYLLVLHISDDLVEDSF